MFIFALLIIKIKFKMARKAKETSEWEVKDRTYQVVGSDGRDAFPTSFSLRVNSSKNNRLIYNDNGVNRAIRYCVNQESVFQDEQEGESTLGRVTFFNGTLSVPAQEITLQKLLSLYHPYKDKKYRELEPEKDAELAFEKEQTYAELASLLFGSKETELNTVARIMLGKKQESMTKTQKVVTILDKAKQDSEYAEQVKDLFLDDNIKLKSVALFGLDNGCVSISKNKDQIQDEKGVGIVKLDFNDDPLNKLVLFLKNKEGEQLLQFIKSKMK